MGQSYLVVFLLFTYVHARDPILDCPTSNSLNGVFSSPSADYWCQPNNKPDAGTVVAYGAVNTYNLDNPSEYQDYSNPLTNASFVPSVGSTSVNIDDASQVCEGPNSCSCVVSSDIGTMSLQTGAVQLLNVSCGSLSTGASISIRATYPHYQYIYQYSTMWYNWYIAETWSCTGECGVNGEQVPPVCVTYTTLYPYYYNIKTEFSASFATCCYSVGAGYMVYSATALPDTTDMVSVFEANLVAIEVVYCVESLNGVYCYSSLRDGPMNIIIGDNDIPVNFMIGVAWTSSSSYVGNWQGPYLGGFPKAKDTPSWGYFGDLRISDYSWARETTSTYGNDWQNTVLPNSNPAYSDDNPVTNGPVHNSYCSFPNCCQRNNDYNNFSYISTPIPGIQDFWNDVNQGSKDTKFYYFYLNEYDMKIGNVTVQATPTGTNGQYEKYQPELTLVPQYMGAGLTGVVSYSGSLSAQTNVSALWDEQITAITIASCYGCVGCTLSTNCTLVITQNPAYLETFQTYVDSDTQGASFASYIYIKPAISSYTVFGALSTNVTKITLQLTVSRTVVAVVSTSNVQLTYSSNEDNVQTTRSVTDNTGASTTVVYSSSDSGLSWWEILLIVVGCIIALIIVVLIAYKVAKGKKKKPKELAEVISDVASAKMAMDQSKSLSDSTASTSKETDKKPGVPEPIWTTVNL